MAYKNEEETYKSIAFGPRKTLFQFFSYICELHTTQNTTNIKITLDASMHDIPVAHNCC